MSAAQLTTLCILVIGLLSMVVLYNSLITVKNEVQKHLANINVLLAQRNSELTKLIDSCKAYMTYEKDTIQGVIQARSQTELAQENKDMVALSSAETAIRQKTQQLLALAENYPDLKANQNFLTLQKRITELESQISDRRELYNESVSNNNRSIEHFPSIIIAKLFTFEAMELLKFNDEQLKDIDIKKGFS